jgi:hypothetical protein
MGYQRISIGFVAAALLALQFQELRADTTSKVIEEVDFAISCGPTSQKAFKHAAWTLHSFWYPEALNRYALERRDWPAAAALSEPAIGFPLERFPWAEAMIAYTRALGDARTGNIAGAEAEIGRLQLLEECSEPSSLV